MKTLVNSLLFFNIALFTEEMPLITLICFILLALINKEVFEDDNI